MSEALYRKYRPQTFEDVVGQTHIERTLKNAIEQDKVGHAYMFCGPRGTGKTTTARLLAKALLCEKGPTPAPDGTCEQCLAIAEGNHPDVYELDAASRTGVDNVREEIIGRVQYAPTRGRYKVYIIDEVHMLSIAAFNALLKTLEEPPSHVAFIMCTTDPQKVPETIQSRCQRFDFHRLSNEEIIARLGAVCTAEDVQFEGDALDLVAHRAQGGMRDALTMLEQLIAFGDGNVTMEVANDVLGSLDVDDMSGIVRSIATRDAAACFTWVSEYVETGADLARFVRDLAAYVRDLYVLSLTDGAVAVNAPQSSLPRMSGEAQMFGIDRLAYILRVLGDLNTELRTSTNPRLSFEIGLTRMVRPQSDLTLESLAARVEVLERALAQGAAAAPAAAQPAAMAQQPASVPPAANAGYRRPVAAPAVAAQPAVAPSPAQVQPTAAQPAAPASPAQASQFQRPVPRPAQTRGLRRQVRDQRRPRGAAPRDSRVLSGRGVAALHRASGAQRVLAAQVEAPPQGGWQDHAGGVRGIRAGLGASGLPRGDRRDRQLLRRGGRIARGGRGRRAGLPRLSRRSPPPHTHEQRAGADEPRDKAPHARRAGVPEHGIDDSPGGSGHGRGRRGLVDAALHGHDGRAGKGGAARAGDRRRDAPARREAGAGRHGVGRRGPEGRLAVL